MVEATLDMVWWKWRTTYTKVWGLKPPAKKISSMSIESREESGDGEMIRVSVQIGKLTWDNSTVVFTPDDLIRYERNKALIESPDKSWAATSEGNKKKVVEAWNAFSAWFKSSENVGDLELATRLLKLFDFVRDCHQVGRPVSLVLFLSFHLDDQTPIRVSEMLLDMDASLDLHRECLDLQRRSKGLFIGHGGASRNIWEQKNHLESAQKRWDFSKERMSLYGFK